MKRRFVLPALVPFVFVGFPNAQESASLFDTPLVVIHDVESPPFQKLLDFDGDGDLDAVGTNIRNDGQRMRVYAWTNDGAGGLTQTLSLEFFPALSHDGDEPLHTEVGDLNGDGLDDFVTGGQGGYYAYLATGGGAFSQVLHQTSPDILDLAVGDFDGDGKEDVSLFKWVFGGASIEVRFADGNVLDAPVNAGFQSHLLVLEADGDTSADLILWEDDVATVYVVTAAQVTPVDALTGSEWYKPMWAAGDVDGDGDDDVVSFNPGPDADYDLFRRTGPGTWVQEPNAPGGPAEYLMDADGDGDLDGVCCGGGGGSNPQWPSLGFESTFEVALNDGNGGFADSFQFPGLGSTSLAGAADVDADGDVDFVAGRVVHYARGPLVATPTPDAFPSPFITRERLIADIDGDGDPELGFVGYAVNQGDGTFGPSGLPPVPGYGVPGEILTTPRYFGDFTGDGVADWIYTRKVNGPPWTFLGQTLVANNGGGGWEILGDAAAPGIEFQILGENGIDNHFAADVNSDGFEDLMVVSIDYYSLLQRRTHMFVNDGTGFLSHRQLILSERGEAVADVDLNSLPDLIASDAGTSLTLHLGTGYPGGDVFKDETLTPFGTWECDTIESPIDVSDYNEDGYPDVAMIDEDGHPRLFFNTTMAQLEPSFAYSDAFENEEVDGERPRIVAADVNDDGLADVVMGPYSEHPNAAFVFLRKPGTSGVLTAADYEPGTLQVLPTLHRADLDGDGDVDFAGEFAARNAAWHPAYGHGARVQTGSAVAGEDEMIPTLGAIGPFRAGSSITVTLSGAMGGSLGVLVFSPHAANLPGLPFPGYTLYVDPFQPGFVQVVLPVLGSADKVGAGTWTGVTPLMPIPAAIAGLTMHHQAFVVDAGGPAGWTQTNELTITYGAP